MTKSEFLTWWPTIALALQILGTLSILVITASLWRLFEKGGEPAWAALIPVYNLLVLLRLARKPWWWAFLLLVPGVNIFVAFVVCWSIAEVFGRGFVFAFGLTFFGFIYLPVLAFGEAEYVTP